MGAEQIIATCPGPTGSIHQLQLRDGDVFELVTFKPTVLRVLDEDEARAWYATTAQCEGKQHRPFPAVRHD